MREDALDLTREDERATGSPVVEGLLAHSVPTQDQPLAGSIPNPEREHSIEPLGERNGFIVLCQVSQHLGVARAGEVMAGRVQLVANLLEVVDLTVEDGADACVLVGQWRIPVHKIDDRETVLTDYATTSVEMPLRIRTAMAL